MVGDRTILLTGTGDSSIIKATDPQFERTSEINTIKSQSVIKVGLLVSTAKQAASITKNNIVKITGSEAVGRQLNTLTTLGTYGAAIAAGGPIGLAYVALDVVKNVIDSNIQITNETNEARFVQQRIGKLNKNKFGGRV